MVDLGLRHLLALTCNLLEEGRSQHPYCFSHTGLSTYQGLPVSVPVWSVLSIGHLHGPSNCRDFRHFAGCNVPRRQNVSQDPSCPLSSEEFDQSLDALWIVRTELRVVELKLCKSRAGCIEDQRVTSSDSLEVPHTHDKLYLLLINLQIIFRRVETGN